MVLPKESGLEDKKEIDGTKVNDALMNLNLLSAHYYVQTTSVEPDSSLFTELNISAHSMTLYTTNS
jgi:hypothetical protein